MKSNLVKSNLLLVFIGLGLLAACSDSNSYSSKRVTKAEVEPVEQIDDVKGTLNDREASPSLIQPKSPQSTTQSTIREFPKSARLTAQQSNSRINLRSKPSSTSPDKGYGLVGDPVKLLDKAEGADGLTWYYVKFDGSGAEGWIRNDFIKISERAQRLSNLIKTEVAKAALLSSQQVDKLIELDSFSKHEFNGYEEGFEDSAKWNGMPFGIIVPTYIPSGFKITHFNVASFHGIDGPGGYNIKYENGSDQSFGISAETGRVGEGAEDYQVVEVVSPALGRVKVGYTEFSRHGSSSESFVWVSQGKIKYFFSSSNLSFSEAAKIVESLDYLNPAPEGYPPTKQWQPF